MDIEFKNPGLKKICEDHRLATRKHGEACAKKLRTRIADIQAAASVLELVAGNPHPLSGDRHMQYSLKLDKGVRLVIEPAVRPYPVRDDGGIDWQQIKKVTIVSIENYHD